MTDTSIFLIIATDHVANTESIQFYARSVYEAKKALVKASLFETQRLSLANGSKKDPQSTAEFFGVNPEPELAVGDTFVFAIQGEAGNNSHSIKIEQISSTETGIIRSVPVIERTLLQTFRLQSVGQYDAAKLKFDVPEDEEVKEGPTTEPPAPTLPEVPAAEPEEEEPETKPEEEKKTPREERTEDDAVGTQSTSPSGNGPATAPEEAPAQQIAKGLDLSGMDDLLDQVVATLRSRRRGKPKKKTKSA